MSFGVPRSLIDVLRCPDDGSTLELESGSAAGEPVVSGTLRCAACGGSWPIAEGIVRFLDEGSLDEESAFEKSVRNQHAIEEGFESDREPGPVSRMELDPTIEALGLTEDSRVLELGCGNGRYTRILAGAADFVLAVDFSEEALLRLRHRLDGARNVGLVQADVTRFSVRPGSFDRSLSTLVSNLPTRTHRDAMYRLASEALTPEGRFVFGTHLHGLRERMLRIEKAGRYPFTDIYRYNFTLTECRDEPAPFFGRVTARPIQIQLPLVRRLSFLDPYRLSRRLERAPLLRMFGALTVCVASAPRETLT